MTLLLLYYTFGLEITYQRYKKLERLDCIYGKEVMLASFWYPLLWLPELMGTLWRAFKAWTRVRYSHWKNKLI